jgi:hypothetical protein
MVELAGSAIQAIVEGLGGGCWDALLTRQRSGPYPAAYPVEAAMVVMTLRRPAVLKVQWSGRHHRRMNPRVSRTEIIEGKRWTRLTA